MNAIPIYDATAPIACTATQDEIAGRIEQIERWRSDLLGVERTPDGLLLRFPDRVDISAHVRAFAVDEKRCCAFWGFDVTTDGDVLTLRWDGPPAVHGVFDRVLAWLSGGEPLSAASGLL